MILATLVACLVIAIHVWVSGGYRIPWKGWNSPDASFYLLMGEKTEVPQPYWRRWYLPRVLGTSVWRWRVVSWGALVATSTLLAGWKGTAAALFFISLPVFRVNVCLPVLTDAVAFFSALVAAHAWTTGHPYTAVGWVLLAGACKESAPVFAAIFAWHPALLIGLAAVRWWGGTPSDIPWLRGGFRGLLTHFRGQHDFLDWKTMLLPWGIVLPLAVVYTTHPLQLAVALLVGYAQLLIASDRARLYQWAAFPVCVAAANAPPQYMPLFLLVSFFNPYRGV